MSIIRNNEHADLWYKINKKMLVYLTVMSGGFHPTLTLCNSMLFGYDKFDMGLSKFELDKLQGVKLKYSTLCENVPQLIIQI